MKRFHVHVSVADLSASIRYYSALFAAEPSVVKDDYAKWMIEDPRVNFAISARGAETGVDHLGFQADDADELTELRRRAEAADMSLQDEGETTCCYARSDKYWLTDPQGIAWEHFHTLGEVPVYGESRKIEAGGQDSACCAPRAPKGKPIGVAVNSTPSCC